MNTISKSLAAVWQEARTRLTQQLAQIPAADLSKNLGGSPNSIGFLLRHIGDVELLFAKNIFGHPNVRITAKTVISGKDTGEWTDLEALKSHLEGAASFLLEAIQNQTDGAWNETVTTNEFGTKTKFEAFGRILSHTAYHAGQLALIHKYANP
jgi:uncharacterized damage-inducible protein DinB